MLANALTGVASVVTLVAAGSGWMLKGGGGPFGEAFALAKDGRLQEAEQAADRYVRGATDTLMHGVDGAVDGPEGKAPPPPADAPIHLPVFDLHLVFGELAHGVQFTTFPAGPAQQASP